MANQYFSIGSPFAEFVGWVYGIVSIVFVFYPFIYLGYRKWKKRLPVSWWMVFGAYFSSALIYVIWNIAIWAALDELLRRYYVNYWWLTNALLEGGAGPFFGIIIGWPMTIFYVCKIKLEKFTLKNIALALVSAITMFALLSASALYLMVLGLGSLANSL